MLEDPTYAQVVRWGDEGDSFVVLEVRVSLLARFVTHGMSRMRDSRNRYFRSISSIAILPVSSGSSTSTTSIKYGIITKRMGSRLTGQEFVHNSLF